MEEVKKLSFEEFREQQKNTKLSKEEWVSLMEQTKIVNKVAKKVKHQAFTSSKNMSLLKKI